MHTMLMNYIVNTLIYAAILEASTMPCLSVSGRCDLGTVSPTPTAVYRSCGSLGFGNGGVRGSEGCPAFRATITLAYAARRVNGCCSYHHFSDCELMNVLAGCFLWCTFANLAAFPKSPQVLGKMAFKKSSV